MVWNFFKRLTSHNATQTPAEITEALEHAKALHEQGLLQQAESHYQKILSQYPDNPDALHGSAILDYQARKIDDALFKINKAIKLSPERVEFFNSKGLALQNIGQHKEALSCLEQGLQLDPQNIFILLNIGNTYRNLEQYEKAIAYYRQVIDMNHDHVGAYCNLGNIHDELNQYEQAVSYYKQALEIDPDYHILYSLLASTLRKLGRLQEAVSYCEKVLSIRPEDAEVLNDLGNFYIELNQHDKALEFYQRAHDLRPEYSLALKNMGVAYQELGMQAEAIHCYQQLEESDDGYAEAQHYLTMLNIEAVDVENVKTMLRLEDNAQDRMHLHYALGKSYSSCKDFKQAFEHYFQANNLKRQTFDYSASVNTAYIDKLIGYYDKAFFDTNTLTGNDSELPVFILGMPRSGTTLVEQIISNHSQVFGAGELTTFAELEQMITIESNNYGSPGQKYKIDVAKFPEAEKHYLETISELRDDEIRITDKLPGNFLRIGLIKLLFPSAKIIHCKRHPVDTCVSIYTNYFADGYKYAYDLKELAGYYVDYLRVMAHWKVLFGESILEVQYEEIVQQQEKISKQMIDYIGLAWESECLNFHKNQRIVKTASNVQVRKPIYKHSVSIWESYRDSLQPLLDVFSQHEVNVE